MFVDRRETYRTIMDPGTVSLFGIYR